MALASGHTALVSASKVQALALRAALTIFSITLKLVQENKLIHYYSNKLLTIYV